ncbi:MAG: hydrogen peroxide-inducible genes activator [Alphaproteobacteria bacterium]|nr:hydrogen peroxide-inducible genes activator [Alphaproteobacteria bacterium]
MIDLTLRQLRFVLALADAAHFGRAAEACGVTQPALSQQVRQIEAAFGVRLFERTTRAVHPTPFGREFLARAALVVAGADALAAFAQSPGGRPTRPLRFGLIPTIAPYLLPDIYPALRRALPDIAVTASEARTDHLLAGLRSGETDLALIATEAPKGAGLAEAPLFADPFVLAAPRAAAMHGPVRLAELPRQSILLLDEGHCLRDQAIDACALRDRDLGQSFSATSLSTIVEFVANGQGITLLPSISLRKEAADRRIALHELEAPGAGRMLRLVWRADTPFAALFEEIADVIRGLGETRLAEPLVG